MRQQSWCRQSGNGGEGPEAMEEVEVVILRFSLAACNPGCLHLVLESVSPKAPYLLENRTAHPFQYRQAGLGETKPASHMAYTCCFPLFWCCPDHIWQALPFLVEFRHHQHTDTYGLLLNCCVELRSHASNMLIACVILQVIYHSSLCQHTQRRALPGKSPRSPTPER